MKSDISWGVIDMGKAKGAVKKWAVLGLSALTALQLAKAPKAFSMGDGSSSGIAKEAKPFKVADAKEIIGQFEKAWVQMQDKFAGKMSVISIPGRLTFKPMRQEGYLSALMVEGDDGAFPVGKDAFIVRAFSKDSIFVLYPEGLKVSESQMLEFALFAYLSVALDGYSYKERLIFPAESLPYMFLEAQSNKPQQKCSPIFAAIGFVAYTVNQENPFELLRLLAKDDVASIKKAVDKFCGSGSWEKMNRVPEGSPLLSIMLDSTLKSNNGKERMHGFLTYMKENFNTDASGLFVL